MLSQLRSDTKTVLLSVRDVSVLGVMQGCIICIMFSHHIKPMWSQYKDLGTLLVTDKGVQVTEGRVRDLSLFQCLRLI